MLGDPTGLLRELDRLDCEESLAAFIRQAWAIIEPGQPYTHGWHIDALCWHLEAVTEGEISRLLINIPPGTMKSLCVGVFWPAWEWGPRNRASTRFVCASHSQNLSVRDNLRMRRLVSSDWYQSLWGDRVSMTRDQNAKIKFENEATGFREAAAAGSITGARGDRVIIDDPHSVTGALSQAERQSTIDWFLEAVPTRLNNPDSSAIVVVMQRLHEDDVSGVILSKDLGYEHLMLPMQFEPDRACVTGIGFTDPRTYEGELLFPERFPLHVVERDTKVMGPYAAAGQFQQRPEIRGGGILQREWWELWDDEAATREGCKPGTFPPFSFILASLDPAYTEKQENDFSALTIWGVWADRNGNRRIMLVKSWAKRLELHALVTDVAITLRKVRADKLLIEAKASGHSVAQELRRLYADDDWAAQLVDPRGGDKVARAYAVQHLFSEGMIYAPDRDWADQVISQCATFPKGKHDDLVDSVTQALSHLRMIGLAQRVEERKVADDEDARHRPQVAPLYEV